MSRPDSKGKASRKCRLVFCPLLACVLVFGMQNKLLPVPVISGPASMSVPSSADGESYQLAMEQSYGFFDDIQDAHWKRAQERARTRVNHLFADPMNHLGKPPRPAWWFLNNYEPDFTCLHERRVGGLGDGPKWVCDPHRLKSKKDCLIYSVGSRGKFEFEKGMHDIVGNACEIHIFDPSPYEKKNMQEDLNAYYHQWGFKSSYDDTPQFPPNSALGKLKFMTLQETMKELGHEGRTIDIFKVDCEGCEMTSIKDWLEVDTRQILVESHGINDKIDEYFHALQDANFYLFHKEPNIHPAASGNCMEWAYIRLHPTFWNGTETE